MAGHGDWYWHELTTPDAEGGAAFYRDVLGWQTTPMPSMPGYLLFRQGDEMRGGVMKMEGPEWAGIAPHWMVYVRVDDVDAVAANVQSRGGSVPYGCFDVPGVGRIAVCKDPQGAVFSIMTPAVA